MKTKQKINWEERRFWVSALIMAGMSANYSHTFIPSTHWASSAVYLADHLLKALAESPQQAPKVSE